MGDLFNATDNDHETWLMAGKYIREINCNKILIMGNKEQRLLDFAFNGDFSKFCEHCCSLGIQCVVPEYCNLTVAGRTLTLIHEPDKIVTNNLVIHGHYHLSGKVDKIGFNVATDLTGFYPISIEGIAELCKMVTYDGEGSTECRNFMGIQDNAIFRKYNKIWSRVFKLEDKG